jgi:hypothetical protein
MKEIAQLHTADRPATDSPLPPRLPNPLTNPSLSLRIISTINNTLLLFQIL